MSDTVQIPRHFVPRPVQRAAWERRLSGQYDYYFKIWHRQLGKDTDDIQYALYNAYQNPGTQAAYVGPDNKWIKRNIWDKYIDGRRHWDSYRDNAEDESLIKVHDTAQQIKMMNNPGDKAEAIIQFIGFKESESLIGSSYDSFFFSELSLYKRNALNFIFPIWDNKRAEGKDFLVNFNFTPRGMNNIAVDMLRAYTGKDDPSEWPGAHGRVYVDVMSADKSLKADGTRLYSDELLETIRQRCIRQFGNDNLFRQEWMCEFTAVNAGLVYPAIEILRKEGRYKKIAINNKYPVYMAMDISSKDKTSDWTTALIFQYYDGQTFIIDYFEDNRKAVVECVQEIAKRDYWHLVQTVALPWDADRSGSRNSPLEECSKQFPGTTFRCLERTYVADGINRVRMLFPNMIINAPTCDWFMECLESWEYRELTSIEDWSASPKHDRYSHLGDNLRYVADAIEQFDFISHGGRQNRMPTHYDHWAGEDVEDDDWSHMPPGMRPSKFSPLHKKKPSDVYGMNENGFYVPK